MTAKRIVDPEKYAAMSKPFPSKLEFDAAVAEFNKGVRALREKHGLTDVYVIVAAAVLVPKKKASGETVEKPEGILTTFNCGSSDRRLPMTAAAFGFEKSNHDQMIESLVNQTRAADEDED